MWQSEMGEGEAKTFPQYAAAICICIGAWSTGTVLGWTSNITDNLKNGDLNGLKMTNHELGWTGSCCTLGAMLVCFPIGFIADCIGRKPTCLATVVPFTAGWLLIIYSKNFLMIYIGRALTGAAGGAFVVIGPIYTAEIAQTHIRGKLGTFVQLFIVIGVLYVEVLGWALPIKAYLLACLVVPLIFALLFVFQPETPFYNLKKGHPDKAKESLRRLRGDNYDLQKEFMIITQELEEEKQKGSFWADLKTKANKKATFICLGLMLYQQLTGVNAMSFYSKDILIQSGSNIPAHFAVMATGVTSFVTTSFAAIIIDSNGRKFLLQISCRVCAFSTLLLGFYFSLKFYSDAKPEDLKFLSFLPALSLILFCVGFNIGLGPIPWLASSELFSPAVKQVMGSMACSVNWFSAFLVTRYCLTVEEKIGIDNTFYIFSGISLSCILFLFLLVPETKNMRYDKIKEELEG